MSNIFISYRRDDSAATCGRIYKYLAAHFGRDAIFKDVDDIPYGIRFPDYLTEQLRACRVELVVIGRQWLTLTTPDGVRDSMRPATSCAPRSKWACVTG